MLKFLLLATFIFSFSLSHAKNAEVMKERKPATPGPYSIGGNVKVGNDHGLPACVGYGVVLATTTLITVKSVKNDDADIAVDKVDLNTFVYACDATAPGDYIGIVFGKKGQHCGVAEPIPNKEEYKGPCKSGWIKKEFFQLLKGSNP